MQSYRSGGTYPLPVRYVSTRGEAPPLDFRGAMLTGLAADGGLYLPEIIPTLPESWRGWSYEQAVTATMTLFGAEEVGPLVLRAASRFTAPDVAPLVDVGDRRVFELFWGPTLAFKDHALQILGGLLDRDVPGPSTVLVATSGDTGSAAIEACRGTKNLSIVVLFPDGLVSEFQRRQMTTVPDENVRAVAVDGTFDDCQALVKDVFGRNRDLLAMNSINWARVAAQAGYYVYLAAKAGDPFDLVVPTGNFGNVYAAFIAKQMGTPIESITIANNANHRLSTLVATGSMGAGQVVPTLAPAMDVAVPSNLERFRGDPTAEFRAGFADDTQIRETIAWVHSDHGYLLDPHTATAWHVADQTGGDLPQVVVATAHPAKFADAVKSAIGRDPVPPPGFEDLMSRPERITRIAADASEVAALVR